MKMKYSRPQLHSLGRRSTRSACVAGSSAAGGGMTCNVGPNFGYYCSIGGGAIFGDWSSVCTNGNIAGGMARACTIGNSAFATQIGCGQGYNAYSGTKGGLCFAGGDK